MTNAATSATNGINNASATSRRESFDPTARFIAPKTAKGSQPRNDTSAAVQPRGTASDPVIDGDAATDHARVNDADQKAEECRNTSRLGHKEKKDSLRVGLPPRRARPIMNEIAVAKPPTSGDTMNASGKLAGVPENRMFTVGKCNCPVMEPVRYAA